jgi:hypothetical protein
VVAGGTAAQRQRLAIDLDAEIRRAFSETYVAQRPLVLERVRRNLHNAVLRAPNGETGDVMAWLQHIVDHDAVNTVNVQGDLGLRPPPPGPAGRFLYDWQFTALGPPDLGRFVTGGIRHGTMRIRRLNPDGSVRWSHDMRISIGTIGLGIDLGTPSVGEASGTPNRLETTHEWTPRDFVGQFWISNAEGNTEPGASTTPEGLGSITFFDGAAHPEVLSGNADGRDVNYGLSVGFAVKFRWGYIQASGVPQTFRRSNIPRIVPEVSGGLTISTAIGFDTGQAEINDDGRQALREICALHLLLLRDPRVRIEVRGEASRLDTDESNLTLTQNRVTNAVRALHDLVDPTLPAGHRLNITDTRPQGEVPATVRGEADRTDPPGSRVVGITISGQEVLRMRQR